VPKCEQSANQLDKMRGKVDTKAALIIREQEQVITAAEKGIKRINSDLKALGKRLQKYLDGADFDEVYYDLKDRYMNKLAERAALERAISIAEESITASQLHVIPGEFDREDY
jgi:uncharacterized Fe-S cluster-containing radical SAM superfamily enzyme